MAALGWLLNMDMALGTGAEPGATSYFLEGVLDGQSVSVPDSVRDNRFRVGTEGVRIRREVS